MFPGFEKFDVEHDGFGAGSFEIIEQLGVSRARKRETDAAQRRVVDDDDAEAGIRFSVVARVTET